MLYRYLYLDCIIATEVIESQKSAELTMKISGLVPINTHHEKQVTQQEHGMRLDLFLTSHFPAYSRSFFQRLIEHSHVTINHQTVVKQGTWLKVNDLVSVFFPGEPQRTFDPASQQLNVQIIYEHEHFLVINKPAGLNVHPPSSRHTEPSLVDWLLAHYTTIATVGYNDRPGIVHRLDKDTSGIMLIARTNYAHANISDQFKQRTIQKTYHALVEGHPERTGSIDFAIARHPKEKCKMTFIKSNDPRITTDTRTGQLFINGVGKIRRALSHYAVAEYLPKHTLVHVKPVTGRTHQIRVHFNGIGHSIAGDAVYGKKSSVIARHALHAYSLTFNFDGKEYSFCAEPPQDFMHALDHMRSCPG